MSIMGMMLLALAAPTERDQRPVLCFVKEGDMFVNERWGVRQGRLVDGDGGYAEYRVAGAVAAIDRAITVRTTIGPVGPVRIEKSSVADASTATFTSKMTFAADFGAANLGATDFAPNVRTRLRGPLTLTLYRDAPQPVPIYSGTLAPVLRGPELHVDLDFANPNDPGLRGLVLATIDSGKTRLAVMQFDLPTNDLKAFQQARHAAWAGQPFTKKAKPPGCSLDE